jgi:hypothetical protein
MTWKSKYRSTKWQRFKHLCRQSALAIIMGGLVTGAFWGGHALGERQGYVQATGTFLSLQQKDHTEAWIEGFRSGIGGW